MSITQQCSKCGRLIPVSEYSEEGFKRAVCKECEQAEQDTHDQRQDVSPNVTTRKICGLCGKMIIGTWSNNSWSKDGLCWNCYQDKKLHRITSPYKSDMSITTKICACCGRERPLQMFYREDSDKCEDCEDWLNGSYPTKLRKCTKCGKELPLFMFTVSSLCIDGVTTHCRYCHALNYNTSTLRADTRIVCAEMGLFDKKIKYADWNGMPMPLFYKKHIETMSMPRGVQRWLAVQEMAKKQGLLEDEQVEEVKAEVKAEPIRPISLTPPTAYPNGRPKTTAPIQERKDWLIKSIRESGSDYPKEILNEFFLYWSERASNGIMRFELEKTWETSRRLQRWFDNSKKFNSSAPTPPPPAAAPTPPKVEPTPPPTPKEEQPVEQATYSPQTITIRFKAGDKVIRLKDGIFLLEQLSGKAQVNMGERPEILYETTDLDMVADKDLFKNKREALERTKLAGIPEERLTYGNKPIK